MNLTGRAGCSSNWHVHSHPIHICFCLSSAKIFKRIYNPRLGLCWVLVARLRIAVRMGRQNCDRAFSSRDSGWLKHICWIHVALRTIDLPICKSHCWLVSIWQIKDPPWRSDYISASQTEQCLKAIALH